MPSETVLQFQMALTFYSRATCILKKNNLAFCQNPCYTVNGQHLLIIGIVSDKYNIVLDVVDVIIRSHAYIAKKEE